MKNIIKSLLLLICSVGLFAACESDTDNNPTFNGATKFVLNTPALATNGVYDLAHSDSVVFTCTQPNYGFPAQTVYKLQLSLSPDMSDSTELSTDFSSARIAAQADEISSTLTQLEVNKGKQESDFPMQIPVYVRLRAYVNTVNGALAGSEIYSNTVELKNVKLTFSLPPVNTPDNLYMVGSFNNWNWDTSLQMVQVYGNTSTFWHMCYIDDSGFKFNTAKAWDDNQIGYTSKYLTVTDNAGAGIGANADGNIVASNPGWYLVIIKCSVKGRDVMYDMQVNKPEVWLMGPVVGNSNWKELEEGMSFSVPSTADGEFVSPAFLGAVPGGDGDGVRMYVKIPGEDWWHSEFIVGIDGDKISYRGTGGDQTRVAGKVSQRAYLNFTAETGYIK